MRADDRHYPLKTGEARLGVSLAGDQVSTMSHSIHIPEEWERAERERKVMMGNVQIGMSALLGALFAKVFFAQISIAVLAAYPHAGWYALLHALAACATTVWWLRRLETPERTTPLPNNSVG